MRLEQLFVSYPFAISHNQYYGTLTFLIGDTRYAPYETDEFTSIILLL